ncbi:MAG TPA: hypothetical protein VES79_05880 [Solirubrobacteraceae bacterium]|nr:hypothetical protein [Solirubrobacteraceae bacterium]
MRRMYLTTLVLLAGAAPAAAAEPDPWATVNVCDTPAHPDEIGIRASMPERAAGAGMYMRFRVQYRDAAERRWRHVSGADSGWRGVGRGRGRAIQSGWSFQVAGGGTQLLRGVAHFQWRRNARVVARARQVTTGGHHSTAGADPRDFSAATCRIDPR